MEFRRFITPLEPPDDVIVVDDSRDADVIILVESGASYASGRWWYSSSEAELSKANPPVLAWDMSDHPAGYLPGFYCSLPKRLFDSRIHRTACYPIEYNELVDYCDPAAADRLVGLHGGITSPLRARIFEVLQRRMPPDNCVLVQQGGPWKQMFDRSGIERKRIYFESLRRSRFFVCPKGNGAGSIRLFETLKAGRVPVIVSDDYVLPEGIDWDSCSLRVKEDDIECLPDLVKAREGEWAVMAANARTTWEEHFSQVSLLRDLGRKARGLLANRPWPGRRSTVFRVAPLVFKTRSKLWAGRTLSDIKISLRRRLG